MQWIFFAWFPTFLQDRFGLSMAESGWNGTLFIQASAIAGILAEGALADRLRRRWPAARLYVAATGVLLSAPFALRRSRKVDHLCSDRVTTPRNRI